MIEDIESHIEQLRYKANEYNARADNLEGGEAIAVSHYSPKTELHTVTCLNCEGVFSTVKTPLDIPLAINSNCPTCYMTNEQKAAKKLIDDEATAVEEIALLHSLKEKYPNE